MRCFTRLSSFLCVFAVCLVFGLNVAYAAEDLPNDPPEDPPYLGGYYISGYSAALGHCTIYIPVAEGWCLDKYGFLFRYASGSVSGKLYTENGTEYDFNAQAFSQPRYRLSNSTGYTYTDLQFNPSASNIVIENSFEEPFDAEYSGQLILIAVTGLILVVLVSKRR